VAAGGVIGRPVPLPYAPDLRTGAPRTTHCGQLTPPPTTRRCGQEGQAATTARKGPGDILVFPGAPSSPGNIAQPSASRRPSPIDSSWGRGEGSPPPDSERTSLLTSLPFACGIAACVLGGFLSDALIRRYGDRKWGRRLVGALGMGLAGASILAVPWAPAP